MVGRDHDDFHVLVFFPEILQNGEAVDVRQTDVQDYHVGGTLHISVETGRTGIGRHHFITLFREVHLQGFTDGFVVIDDKNLGHTVAPLDPAQFPFLSTAAPRRFAVSLPTEGSHDHGTPSPLRLRISMFPR